MCSKNPILKLCLRTVVSILSFSLIFSQSAISQAQMASFYLPYPGVMVDLSGTYVPALIKGLIVHPENPLEFDFIVDTGDSRLQGDAIKAESLKMVKYFLAALTVPEKDLWVNLSPYEKDRIVPQGFGETDMGRDLLAEDYLLKQITSSLIYPEKQLGKEFWNKVYAKAQQKFGTTQIPVNTFNKVWIVPQKAVVWEHNNKVLIVESHLKVMLEEDYLSLEKHRDAINRVSTINNINTIGSQIIREIVIPALEKEVNGGKNFATLRQIYNAMILATWYKKELRESILGKAYANQNKISGIDLKDKDSKENIYKQYLRAFKKGVYNYIKEEPDPISGTMIPRRYFSGGFSASSKRWALSGLLIAGLLGGAFKTLPVQAQANISLAGVAQGEQVLVNWQVQEFGDKANEAMLADIRNSGLIALGVGLGFMGLAIISTVVYLATRKKVSNNTSVSSPEPASTPIAIATQPGRTSESLTATGPTRDQLIDQNITILAKATNTYTYHAALHQLVSLGKGIPRVEEALLSYMERTADSSLPRTLLEWGVESSRLVNAYLIAITSADNNTRSEAVDGLAKTAQPGDLRAIQALTARLGDHGYGRSEYIYKKAEQGLAILKASNDQLAPGYVAVLLVPDNHLDVRVNAANKLGDLDRPEVVPSLTNALQATQDNQLRSAIIRALGKLHDRQVFPLLLTYLVQETPYQVRLSAIWALGEIGDPSAVEPLMAHAQDTDDNIRLSVIRALDALDDIRTVGTLARGFKDPYEPVRAFALQGLIKLKPKGSIDSILEFLGVDEDRSSSIGFKTAGTLLVSMGASEEQKSSGYIAALSKVSVPVIVNAANHLGSLRDPRAVKPLIQTLFLDNEEIRKAVESALRLMMDSAAKEIVRQTLAGTTEIPPRVREILEKLLNVEKARQDEVIQGLLSDLLRTDKPRERENAIRELTRLRELRAIDPLIGIAGSKFDPLRLNAIQALGQLKNNKAYNVISSALIENEERLRAVAAEALGQLGNADAITTLTGLLADDRPSVYQAAEASLRLLEATPDQMIAAYMAVLPVSKGLAAVNAAKQLGELKAKSSSDALVLVLEKNDSSKELLATTARALGKIGNTENDKVVPALAKRLEHPEAIVRLASVNSLGLLDAKGEVTAIIGRLQDADVSVGNAAVEALEKLKDPSAIDPLLKVMTKYPLAKAAAIKLGASADQIKNAWYVLASSGDIAAVKESIALKDVRIIPWLLESVKMGKHFDFAIDGLTSLDAPKNEILDAYISAIGIVSSLKDRILIIKKLEELKSRKAIPALLSIIAKVKEETGKIIPVSEEYNVDGRKVSHLAADAIRAIGGYEHEDILWLFKAQDTTVHADVYELLDKAIELKHQGITFDVKVTPEGRDRGTSYSGNSYNYLIKEKVELVAKNSAMTAKEPLTAQETKNVTRHVGGINLDPAMLDMQIKRDDNGVVLPLSQQSLQTMHIKGVIPFIQSITSTSIPLLFGFDSKPQ